MKLSDLQKQARRLINDCPKVRLASSPLYQQLKTRTYPKTEGYESWNHQIIRWTTSEKENQSPTSKFDNFILQKLKAYDFPIYWVGENLLTALEQTNLEGITVENLKLPMPAAAFFLPYNAVSKEDLKVTVISYAAEGDNNIVFFADTYYGNLDSAGRIDRSDVFNISTVRSIFGIETFSLRVRELLIKLLLAWQTRPDLLSQEVGNSKSKGFGSSGNVTWNQNWIGKSYQYRTVNTSSGNGISKRTHWRKGHSRVQRYGPGLVDKRMIWIEPILINPPK